MKSFLSVEGLSAAPLNLVTGSFLNPGKVTSIQGSGSTVRVNPKKPLPSYTTEYGAGSAIYEEMFN
jgi:hypothetical protein